MKKKIANAVELLLLVVSFIIMSLNIITSPYGNISLMDCISKYTLVYIPMLVLFGLCAVMCLISIISKNTEKDGKAHIAVAILLFISVFYNTISCSSDDNLFANYPAVFTALFSILFAVIVIACAKRSSLIASSGNKATVQKTVINNIKENTSADELKKYKDLLDAGAITQEEFDIKKKQLLNL